MFILLDPIFILIDLKFIFLDLRFTYIKYKLAEVPTFVELFVSISRFA